MKYELQCHVWDATRRDKFEGSASASACRSARRSIASGHTRRIYGQSKIDPWIFPTRAMQYYSEEFRWFRSARQVQV
eukprot:3541514-Pyramimonas_sp.AAC.1